MGNFLKNLHPLLKRTQNKKDNQDPNYALINTLSEEMNEIERDAIESKLQSSLKSATSEYLNTFGDWFGVYRRTNEDDDKYRARIIRYLLLKRGTNNSIIEAIREYLEKEDLDVSVYEPYTNIFYTNKSNLNGEDHLMGYYYRFAVINVTVGDYFPLEIIDIINEFKPAGVTLYVTYDGASTIRGGYVLDWMKDLPKVETYQEYDRFLGYDEMFYGHINMNESKDSDHTSTDIFKTNRSLINSLDVLTGSSSVGREYTNYGYVTSYAYSPRRTSTVTHINTGTRGKEVSRDYYMQTHEKSNRRVSVEISTDSGVSYLYNNFNIREYFSKYRPQLLVGEGDIKRNVSDFIGELTIDFFLNATLPPDDAIDLKLQVYDFSIDKWVTVRREDISFYEENIGANIGYTKDYLNDELNMFTRIEVTTSKDEIELNINYVDLLFYHYQRGVYTVKPYKGEVSNYLTMITDSYAEAYKVASLDNGDIISKSGYQPIGYLRLTDGYDNNIGRNLLLDSKNIKMAPNNSGTGIATQESDGSWTVVSEEDKVTSLYRFIKHTTLQGLTSEDIENGVWYTFSIDIKATEDVTISIGSNIVEPYNPSEVNGTRTFYSVKKGNYQRLSFSFRANEGVENLPIIILSTGENDKSVSIRYNNMKLEEGITKDVKWQPNPEDIYGANDPNNRITIQAKDKEGRVVEGREIPSQETKPGMNLIADKDLIKNTSKGSYVQGTTKELTISLWGSRITQTGSMEGKLIPGKTYTISYDLEMLEEPTEPVFRHSPGIIVYSRQPGNVIAETRFVNSSDNQRRIPVGTRERVELTFTMPDVDNVELTAYTGLFNESGDASPYETRKYSVVKFSNIKLEEGVEATPYSPSPEDFVNFLDKKVRYNDIKTSIQNIGIKNDFVIPYIDLQYSFYGDSWVSLKELTEVPIGETVTTNNLIDLYGLQMVDYSNITPMSNVSLRSIWDVPIGEITNQEGSLSNMSNNFFNAVWQETDVLSTAKYTTMRVVRDTEGGVFDGSTGEVVNLLDFNVESYTSLDRLSFSTNKYTEYINLGSYRLISELAEELLTIEEKEIDNSIKVIHTSTEQETNTSIIKHGFEERETSNSVYLSYELYEPIEEGQQYELVVEGDFKENIEFVSLYNSNASFNETFIYPEDIINGKGRKTFTAKESTAYNPRLNTDLRLYFRPYDSNVTRIRRVEVRKL